MEPTSNQLRHRSFNRATAAAVIVCFVGAALAFAYYYIFSRGMSLDEGYLMITIQGFLDGHALYDSVFTQYGPFYYFYEWIVRGPLHVPLTHDATRFLCIVHWGLAATIFGVVGWSATRSFFVALFLAVQTFVHLAPLAHEPGHPQELVAVLLGFGLLAAVKFPQGRISFPALAIIAALLVFTKINVGVFFGFALLLATTCGHSTLPVQRWINWLLLAACSALPFLLMRRHLGVEWSRNYAVVVAITAVVTLFVAQRTSGQSGTLARRLVHLGLITGLCCAMLLGVTLLSGSSWRGIIDGLLLTPLKMPGVAFLGIAMPVTVLINAAAALLAAVAVMPNRSNPRVGLLVKVLKAVFGITGAFILIGRAPLQLAYLLPWVWLVAVPASPDEPHSGKFLRGFLSIASAWQGLQAYPIAGTQVTLATLLLVVAYAMCLRDVWNVVAASPRFQKRVANWPATQVRLAGALAVIGLFFLFINVWCALPTVRREHTSLRPLGLPGSTHVRMEDEIVQLYQDTSEYLRAQSDAFVTYPGINSLYFWTEQRPPTQINGTGWGQLSHTQQEEILTSLRGTKRPRFLVVESMMRTWAPVPPEPILPLVRFVTQECRPERRIGRFIIFTLKSDRDSPAAR